MRILTLLLGLAAFPALAQDRPGDDYRHGRVFHVEPGVVLQRATETGAEEAVVNIPFLPGDRVWTDAAGRADFQFPDGTRLRLDSRAKIDYAAHDEGRGERIVIRLWSGSLFLHVRGAGRAAYEVETPGGLVEALEAGVYRVDVDAGETRLTVLEGEATLDTGEKRVRVEAGERTYAVRGEGAPEPPAPFEEPPDEFALWDRERDRREAWAAGSRRYLPDELDAYAPELETNGTWYYETQAGYVWRPYVTAGWQPYTNGRWCWTSYGWTWVPAEPWGWAPSHYGRWGHSLSLGWYWIPGRTWGPAWVSWAHGGGYVGWCPLGYRDRPVHHPRVKGHAVPRGSMGRDSWTYVRREALASRDLARRRTELSPEALGGLRVAESPSLRPTRDLSGLAEIGPTAPRAARRRPTPGDTVPELRRDNQTEVGVAPRTPSGRSRAGSEAAYDRRQTTGDAGPRAVARPGSAAPGAERDRPADVRAPRGRARVADEPVGAAAPADAPRAASPRRSTPRSSVAERPPRSERSDDPERDVLHRLFQPLSGSRTPSGGERQDAERARPRSGQRPRPEGSARPSGGSWRSSEDRPRPSSSGASPRAAPRSASPRSEPRSVSPRSEPRSVSPRSEQRAPRSEPRSPRAEAGGRSGGASPRASSPRPAPSSPRSGASARPRRERE